MAQSVDLRTFQQLHATDLIRLLLAMDDTSFSSAILRSFRPSSSVYHPRSTPAPLPCDSLLQLDTNRSRLTTMCVDYQNN